MHIMHYNLQIYISSHEFTYIYMYKLCENTKNYKYAYPGSNKVVYGACEQESEEKIQNFDF